MSVRITPGAAPAVAKLLAKADKAVTLSEGEKRGSVLVDSGTTVAVVNNRGKVEELA